MQDGIKESSSHKSSYQISQEPRILQESCFWEMLFFDFCEGLPVRRGTVFSIPYHFLMAKWSLTRNGWQPRAVSTLQQSKWWSTKCMAVLEHLKLCLKETWRMNHRRPFIARAYSYSIIHKWIIYGKVLQLDCPPKTSLLKKWTFENRIKQNKISKVNSLEQGKYTQANK